MSRSFVCSYHYKIIRKGDRDREKSQGEPVFERTKMRLLQEQQMYEYTIPVIERAKKYLGSLTNVFDM